MFSTFTGNSRRPRNVNLSGGAGNPFANTSWSPSAVSNTTKTISDAQADRERRQAERQRLKAAATIQRTWRGHKDRMLVANHRRAIFDSLYESNTISEGLRRIQTAFTLLLGFYSPNNSDDEERLFQYAADAGSVDVTQLYPPDTSTLRLQRFVQLLTKSLESGFSAENIRAEQRQVLELLLRIISKSPHSILGSTGSFFIALSLLAQNSAAAVEWQDLLFTAVASILAVHSVEIARSSYVSFARYFLTASNLRVFENDIGRYTKVVDHNRLAEAIISIYDDAPFQTNSNSNLLWLLSHFIHLGGVNIDSDSSLTRLRAAFTQITSLAKDISVEVAPRNLSAQTEMDIDGISSPSSNTYVKAQLESLVDSSGIANLIRDFATSLSNSSDENLQGASLFAGYTLALLQSFPNNADDVRMRLFLEEISTPAGSVPIVKFLWQMMQQTSVFNAVNSGKESPIKILGRYLNSSLHNPTEVAESREWRIVLLFLELYTFILRLSDDDDFFSGIRPQILLNQRPISRIRACSLSLEDIVNLTVFLKNTAFPLYYQAAKLLESRQRQEAAAQYRLDNYLGSDINPDLSSNKHGAVSIDSSTYPLRLSFESLRGIITTSLKMLYERDSRQQFLPKDHWLMSEKLEGEDFVNAVIAEDERQQLEELSDSDEEMGDSEQAATEEDPFAFFGNQRVSRNARLERMRIQQRRAQRERRLAEMGPKLEILKNMPFVVPFETRVTIFRHFIELDKARREGANPSLLSPFARHHQAEIHRGSLFEDAYREFYKLGDGLKDPIQITFVDKFGSQEAGIDGGGVTKEFLLSVTSEAFANEENKLGMFASSRKGLLYPNPVAMDALKEKLRQRGFTESYPEWRQTVSEQLKRYEFLGRIVGKCLYEGILVDLAFAGFFLLKWPSGSNDENTYKGSVNDLVDMDEELYNGMLRLKNYSGDVADLALDFTVTDQISSPGEPVKTVSRNLMPNGDQTFVTNDNRLLYISYVARHRLSVQPAAQTAAFLRGLRMIIRPSWLSMFNQSELQHLVGGDSSDIDIEDLRQNTLYSGLYEIGTDGREHPTIALFWRAVKSFTDAQRRDLLKYVSSTPRAPLLGFSQLRPKFCIRDSGTDESRLPSTSTCVNLLKLPIYTNESKLKEKLLYAISSGAGFDLS